MSIKVVTAFAPATVANVAVGFDILGFALSGLGEVARVERIDKSFGVIITPTQGFPEIPTDPRKNTATAGLIRLINEKKLNFGFRVTLEKIIPVGSGLGGSSTSAVAALIAANALLPKKLTRAELFDYALTGEQIASGSRHADNIAPCLEGGLVFVRSQPSIQALKIPTPKSLRCVIILPDVAIHTKSAREILKNEVSLKAMVEQTANLSGFLLGCISGDLKLIQSSLKDAVIEPQRAKLIPSFYEFQNAALTSGALGCSISGSGPALFALAGSQRQAEKTRRALLATAETLNIKLRGSWISPINGKGAHVLSVKAGAKK